VELPDEVVEKRFPKGHLNKLGVIIKTRKNGVRKVRLVVDMRRSRANLRARVPERPVLPRPKDPVDVVFDLFNDDLTWAAAEATDFDVEAASADFQDAYCHICTHPDEYANCLVAAPPKERIMPWFKKSKGRPKVAVMNKIGFGSKGGPLVWSRVAAASGRMGQALLRAFRNKRVPWGRLNIYLDDPFFVLAGNRRSRDHQLCYVLLLWRACGFKLAWDKGSRGGILDWIGLEYKIDWKQKEVTLTIPSKMAKDIASDASALLGKPMVPIRDLKRLAGKGGWVMSVVPKAAWTIKRIWAAVASEERLVKQIQVGSATRTGGGGQRHSLIALKQVEPALNWIAFGVMGIWCWLVNSA
jgi:hypothetical protein